MSEVLLHISELGFFSFVVDDTIELLPWSYSIKDEYGEGARCKCGE